MGKIKDLGDTTHGTAVSKVINMSDLYWYDRLLKSRAMGVNTVQVYVAWNMHEWHEGQYKFSGWSNLPKFLQLIDQLGLLVSLRPSPYIDSEWDMGGLPWWLLKYPQMKLRSSDSAYLAVVKRWYDVLLPLVKPYMYQNGGPIISVQIENEYSANGCDKSYITYLKDLVIHHLGSEVVLFTNDFGMACDVVPSVYPTLDFGIGVDVKQIFAAQRQLAPKGPLVNSEFYPGWMDMWGQNHQTRPTTAVLETISDMWTLNASFTVYVTVGGTLWGYSAGGEGIDKNEFTSVTTSYDFDAPISESGDTTSKFVAIRNHLQTLSGLVNPYEIPSNSTKFAYGNLILKPIGTFLDLLNILCPSSNAIHTKYSLNVEQFDFPYGFVVYQTVAKVSGSVMDLTGIRDRAYVVVNGVLKAVVQRPINSTTNCGVVNIGDKINILVENQGRICFGPLINDRKGIVTNVTLNGYILTDWTIYPLDINNLFKKNISKGQITTLTNGSYMPAFYSGILSTSQMYDTFLSTIGWGKGQAFVNGINLGRYWSVGPTHTLFLPKPFLESINDFVIFELDNPGNCKDSLCRMTLVDGPIVL